MKTTQRLLARSFLALPLFAFISPLMADALVEGHFAILAPVNGADLASGSGNTLRYIVALTPDGDHLHVYVDDQKPIIDEDVTNCPCSIELPTLSPGMHTVAVKEATKDHHLTGLQGKVSFKVE